MKTKQVTIKDIASRLGISHSTVSRALSSSESYLVNDDTMKQVKQTAEEMEYTPNLLAKGFVTGKTGTLGLVSFRIALEGSGKRVGRILELAARVNYNVLMGLSVEQVGRTLSEDQDIQVNQLIARGVDGLLVDTRGGRTESSRIDRIVRGRLPVVTYCHPLDDFSGVVLDMVADFYEATTYLISLGHRRIGYIGMNLDETHPITFKVRGYIQAMQDHGLPHEIVEAHGDQSQGGYKQGKILKDRFTAIVCRNDYTAIGLYRGLWESGLKVPDDVAVVGHDNIDVSSYLVPALTTMASPTEEIAQSVIDLMLRKLDGDDSAREIKVRSRLIVRESCGGKQV